MTGHEVDQDAGIEVPPARRRLIVASTVMVAAVVVGAGGWMYSAHRDDVALEQAQRDVARAAADAVELVLSYRPDSVHDDMTRAQEYLTGEFLDYYTKFGADVVVPSAIERGLSSSVDVAATSVVTASPDLATALVYIDQSTTEASSMTPTTSQSSLLVELERVDGRWLVSKLDTV
ncbi:hypothetical protein O4214_24160 [Rhodococcus erythropolis]|uniref:hypothetical protein n=1 Tax=Rhodococcus erythropolis TaxID=1833 RepID=UPI001E444BC1|nr:MULTISPECIES: hypothetical protein [Rhodococcus erythropolis group]MCD2107917.1 hypothetical protein [Rhodococcus qingshengii]MCZ4527088.1 hypothetical protein [Rhodococcus erythropolis]